MNIYSFIVSSENKTKEIFLGLSAQDLSSVVAGVSGFFSILAVIFGFCKYFSEVKKRKKLDIKESYLKLKNDIEKKIELFYGPCISLREESSILYSIFARKLKSKSGKRFRTLRYLCKHDKSDLSKADSAILKEIIQISSKNLILIEQYSWLISNTALSSLLGKLCAHFRILELAYKGSLEGQEEYMENIVFPLEVDGALYSEMKRLKAQLNETNIESKKNKSIAYYNDNYEEYYTQTINVKLDEIYKEFLKLVPSGGTILDAGCGVGRDTKYFIQNGYKVHSFDLSDKMVMLCNQYPFAFCELKSFSDIDLYEEFDAVWANASLLHLSKKELFVAFLNLKMSLKKNGVLFFSIKKIYSNKLKNSINGREFYSYKSDFLDNYLCKKIKMKKIKSWESRKSDNDIFVNYLYRKNEE